MLLPDQHHLGEVESDSDSELELEGEEGEEGARKPGGKACRQLFGTCDVTGKHLTLGDWYHRRQLGEDFDLCGEEFRRRPALEQRLFVAVTTPEALGDERSGYERDGGDDDDEEAAASPPRGRTSAYTKAAAARVAATELRQPASELGGGLGLEDIQRVLRSTGRAPHGVVHPPTPLPSLPRPCNQSRADARVRARCLPHPSPFLPSPSFLPFVQPPLRSC